MTVQSSSPQPNQQPAGWYDVGQGWARYWDGQSWSEAITHEALQAQQAAQQQAAPPAPQQQAAPSYQQPQAPAQSGYQDPNAGYQQPQAPAQSGYQDPNAGYQQPQAPAQSGYQDPNAGYQPPGPPGYQPPGGGYQPPAPPGSQPPGLQGLQQGLQGALAGLQVPDLAATGPGGLPVILFPAIIAASALLVLLGSLLPWATIETGFGSISVRGTEGSDGVLTLLLGLAGGAAAVAVVMARKPMAAIGGIVAGGLALAIGLYDFIDLARATGDSSGLVQAHTGFGLWLVLLGSLAMTGASIAVLVLNKQQPATAQAPASSAW